MKKHLRHLALLLAVLMLFTVLPTGVCAREESPLSIEGIRSSYRDNTTYFEVDFKNISGKPVSDIYPIPLAYDADLNYAGLVNTIQRHKGTLKPGETVTLKYSCSGKVFALGYDFLFYTDASGNTASVLLECILVPANASVPSEEEEGATFSGTTFSAGIYHSVFIWPDGTVGTVGFTSKGRCDVEDWSDIIAVSAASHTVGLRADGTVVAVGPDSHGQCDVERWEDITAVATGNEHTVGLRADGTVVATGKNEQNRCDVSDWKDITAIAAGARNTYGIKANGTVVAAGSNARGQRNIGSWSNITAISAGYDHVVGLKDDGTVIAVGSNDAGQCDVKEWTDIVAISANYMYTLGLKKDGTVLSTNEETIPTSSWRDIVAISAGNIHALGQKSDGTLVATGDNGHGRCNVEDAQVAIATGNKGPRTIAGNVVQVAVTDTYYTMAVLRSDGTVRSVMADSDQKDQLSGWQNIVKLWTCFDNIYGLTADGCVLSTRDVYEWNTEVENLLFTDDGICLGTAKDGTLMEPIDGGKYHQNSVFDLSGWRDITDVIGTKECLLGLSADGTVRVAGSRAIQKGITQLKIKDIETLFLSFSDNIYAISSKGIAYQIDTDALSCHALEWKNVKMLKEYAGELYAITDSGDVYSSHTPKKKIPGFHNIVDLALSNDAIGIRGDGSAAYYSYYGDMGKPVHYDLSGWTDAVKVKVSDFGTYVHGLKSDGTFMHYVQGVQRVLFTDNTEEIADFWMCPSVLDVVALTEDGKFINITSEFSQEQLDYLTADVKH